MNLHPKPSGCGFIFTSNHNTQVNLLLFTGTYYYCSFFYVAIQFYQHADSDLKGAYDATITNMFSSIPGSLLLFDLNVFYLKLAFGVALFGSG